MQSVTAAPAKRPESGVRVPRLKQTVFISSTCVDLPEHREHVISACKELGLDYDALEHWPAVSADGVEESLRHVDEADIYLGIFGQRYGYVPDGQPKGQEISITEMEYRRAKARTPSIPRLIFLADVGHNWTMKELEDSLEYRDKLAALRKDLASRHTCKMFKSAEQLHTQAVVALATLLIQDLNNKIARLESGFHAGSEPSAKAQAPAVEKAAERPAEAATPPPVTAATPPEAREKVAVRFMLAASEEDDKWDYVPAASATLRKGSRLRVMALPETRCYLLLIVQAIGNEGTPLELTVFGPRLAVEGSESLLTEPSGIWQSLPSGTYLQEEHPEEVAKWKLGFLVSRTPPDELLRILLSSPQPSIEKIQQCLRAQGGTGAETGQAAGGSISAENAELLRLETNSAQLHWTEVAFQ